MPPRRSHKKSRAGCRRCKSRKIKCDEFHPRCGNCVKHGVDCDFENPDVISELQIDVLPSTPGSSVGFRSPIIRASTSASAYSVPGSSRSAAPLYRTPASQALSTTTPANQRLLELKLMHHYTLLTCKTFTFTAPVTEDIWKITVPNLAFSGSQHLADAILAVAALHLRSMTPNDKDLVRASHAYMASSLAEYSATLTRGIDNTNAETLFLTAALIAFQSTATRVFIKDELSLGTFVPGSSGGGDHGQGQGSSARGHDDERRDHSPSGCYSIPFAWFHSFQGVKAITAASWQYLRVSPVVTQVINSQVVLQLDFTSGPDTFFGHLLDGMEEELAAMGPPSPQNNAIPSSSHQQTPHDNNNNDRHHNNSGSNNSDTPPDHHRELVVSTRQAYQHAVAVLNWAHKIPHKGAPLAFPATVSRRYIELLEERRPRALAVLACFFALLKSMDSIWWLQGMARREVLGVVSLFNSDFFGPDAYTRWWPHLEWAMRIALYEHPGAAAGEPIPADVWGADWYAEEEALLGREREEQERGAGDGAGGGGAGIPNSYFRHIEMLSQMVSAVHSVPAVPETVSL